MPSLVQLSLAVPGRLPAGRMPKPDDIGIPPRAYNRPLTGMDLEDPVGLHKVRLWNRWSPVGTGHGPAIGNEKRATEWSPGMQELYDYDRWKADGSLQRRVQYSSPNLPPWMGRAPTFLGISGETIGNKVQGWLNGVKRPTWLKPGLPATGAGAVVGGLAGMALGHVGSFLNPDLQVDPTRTGLLGALLGAAVGGLRKR